jgi:serine/threonine protein phosphatase PrpC
MRRGGIAVDVARDMKATDSCEIARIARAGGHVSNGRVNGSLAIARAIGTPETYLCLAVYYVWFIMLSSFYAGDKSLKKGSSPALTAEPEIVTFRFQEDDEFLLIASDGLWDVMTSQVTEVDTITLRVLCGDLYIQQVNVMGLGALFLQAAVDMAADMLQKSDVLSAILGTVVEYYCVNKHFPANALCVLLNW